MNRTDCRKNVSPQQLRAFQRTTNELAEIAERAYSGFRNPHDFGRKADGSRVTQLDREVERLWRVHLEANHPTHAIVGEEYGRQGDGEEFCWVLDPVDGTDDLSRGIPLYGYIAALNFRGHPVAATTGHPSLGIRSMATYGQGAYVNGRRVEGINARSADDPAIAIPAAAEFLRDGDDTERFRRLAAAFPNHRIYRNVFAHTAVLTGALEAAIELDVAIWDVLATRLLIEEAGGRYVSLGAFTDDSGVDRTSAVFGVAQVVDLVLEVIAGGD